MSLFSPARPLRAETRLFPGVVLSRPSPCNVPQGYASVAELPAALLGCHFEHPAGEISPCPDVQTIEVLACRNGYSEA